MNENSKEVLMNNPFIKESRECFIEGDALNQALKSAAERKYDVSKGFKHNDVWVFKDPKNKEV